LPVRSYTDAKGRKRYAVEFESKGIRLFRRLPPGATKAQATEFEARERSRIIDHEILGKLPDVTLDTAIRGWLEESVAGRKSELQTGSHARAVQERIERDLPSASLRDAERLSANIRADESLSPATRNRRLCVLKAVLKFAWRKGWTEDNLSGKIQLLPERKYQRREITPDMAAKLIKHASTPRAKALIALSAYTGLRLGEVLKLAPEDVKGGVIVARDTKNGTDRIIPILPELKPHLSQLPFDAGWRNVYRGFERARERAGLDIRYHDLRHMVASALARSGADLRVSMDLMGHKSIETHRRYVHTDLDAKRQALERALGHQNPIRRGKKARTKAKKVA
jgi:integrase